MKVWARILLQVVSEERILNLLSKIASGDERGRGG